MGCYRRCRSAHKRRQGGFVCWGVTVVGAEGALWSPVCDEGGAVLVTVQDAARRARRAASWTAPARDAWSGAGRDDRMAVSIEPQDARGLDSVIEMVEPRQGRIQDLAAARFRVLRSARSCASLRR